MTIVTSGITMFVLVLGPVMLNLLTSFARVSAMVNDHELPPRLHNLANSILVILLRLLISLDFALILITLLEFKLSALIIQSCHFILVQLFCDT